MIPYIFELNIFQNGYISPDDIKHLKSLGITHLLNLHKPYPYLDEFIEAGFFVKQTFLHDLTPIETQIAVEIIDYIYNSISQEKNKIFIHCLAGTNRSPAVIWLYYLSIGYSVEESTKRIISTNKYLVVPDPIFISNLNLELIKNRHD